LTRKHGVEDNEVALSVVAIVAATETVPAEPVDHGHERGNLFVNGLSRTPTPQTTILPREHRCPTPS
jgi:hypothetical protein